MLRQPNNLHPEVFTEVWKKWSSLCASFEAEKGYITKPIENRLWTASLKIVDYNIRLDWMAFCRKHFIGVFK